MIRPVEHGLQGKSPTLPCEDDIVVTPCYAAVIDGATSKSSVRYDGMTTGKIASLLIADGIRRMPAEYSMEQAALWLTDIVSTYYRSHHIEEEVMQDATRRLTASAVIYSNSRREVWLMGDCQCRFSHHTITNHKTVDTILATIRGDILHHLLAEGEAPECLQSHDPGREMITDALRDQCNFQNYQSDCPYSFPVIDGTPIDPCRVPVYPVEKASEIILASDGYPQLFDTLRETEDFLKSQLRRDPLCIDALSSTKGKQLNNASFDDRSYLRLAI